LRLTSKHCSLCTWLSGLKTLLIGHSACWVDGLRALAGLDSNPGLGGFFGWIRLAAMLWD